MAGGALAAAACGGGDNAGGGDGGRASSATPTTGSPPTTAAFDPSVPWWLQGGFAPVTEEVEAVDLAIIGALPATLSGLYVRNGSNPRTGTSSHWFFGDGMVHGMRLEAGQARWYRNRYVRTPMYEASAGFGELGGAPGGTATQSNVSAIRYGDRRHLRAHRARRHRRGRRPGGPHPDAPAGALRLPRGLAPGLTPAALTARR